MCALRITQGATLIEETIREWVEAHRWAVLLALVGVILIGTGVFWAKTQEERLPVQVLAATASAELVVDVGGEVVRPGVYRLPMGSRVEDALRVAGGETEGADTDYIEKYLNRAARLSDGQKVYIPHKSEIRNTKSETININTASQGELEGLPGIGPDRAGKIIAGRHYQNISELVEKKIVGQKVYEQIKDLISVW